MKNAYFLLMFIFLLSPIYQGIRLYLTPSCFAELRQELQVRSHNREAFSNGILSSSPITDRCLTPKSRSIESDKLANEYKESPIKGKGGFAISTVLQILIHDNIVQDYWIMLKW